MKVSAAVVTIVALASTVAAQMNYTSCSSYSAFHLTSVSWSPSPACIGKDLCAIGTGTLDQPIIQGAKLSLSAKYLGRVVYTDSQDLCAVLAAQGTPCPIPAGLAVLKGCVKIKATAPANVTTIRDSKKNAQTTM